MNNKTLVLHYHKNLGITKTQVMQEKEKMRYPKAWKFKDELDQFKLVFDKTNFKKYYGRYQWEHTEA